MAENKLTRRSFLKRAALAAGALGLPARCWAQVPGANQDIRMAVIGLNGRGRNHIDEWRKISGVRLTALCDVDRAVLAGAVRACDKDGIKVQAYGDIRKLFDNADVDAISIATPNHWHALAAVWGMQAGKDVYVEKPVSYDIWEGEQLVAAAQHYKKIVQAGTQIRSSQGICEAVDWVDQGHLGKIIVARALCYKRRASIGKTAGPQLIPPSVNYDLWTGPAPLKAPRRAHFHYDWHWFWDYGAGDLGNQGVHEMDLARWFLGADTVAYQNLAAGGRLGYDDDGQTPNTLITWHNYDRAPLVMEVRGLPEKTGSNKMDKYDGASIGVVIECEGGRMVVPDYKNARAYDKQGKEVRSFSGPNNHFQNFIDAMRTRREDDLHAKIIDGHRSTALCHAANISYRLGAGRPPGEIREQIKGDPEALPAFERMREHLAANGVDLDKTMAVLGAMVKINPLNNRIVENKEANRLWRRAPRAGYVMKVA